MNIIFLCASARPENDIGSGLQPLLEPAAANQIYAFQGEG